MNRLDAYRALMRMDKPIGTWLLAWPTFWALLIAANGDPSVRLVVIFAAGVFLMRSAGCVINDFADRHIDGQVERTKERPLAKKAVSSFEAIVLFAILIFLALLLVLTLNKLTIILAFIAAALAILYPFTKRWTHGPQFILGAAFSMSIPMAFAAATNSLPLVCWVLFVANLFWTVAYDTEYAMVDREDDLKVGVKSTAILTGKYDIPFIALLQILAVALLAYVGYTMQATYAYWGGLIGMAGLFFWQLILIRNRDTDACFLAFRQNHYAGMIFAIGLALHYWLPVPFGASV
ncbi:MULTISPECIES: 4-hydroxybenzoate octaprenyltransferase [Gammaproteobacteria]|uniref:4-hydroxybenzoate octaprenyltransferase n=1 Tax=Gammaproteobacteria TaxID=1236 RepID=UPI000DCFA27C|nr:MULTISPECIES: 4-hydroxybenzoate octaprenyltransferase [Gammaproteobacteria]RTE86471.1 4-hydroxybenzoate octaprenyltransferase [Aliidiomarina sp. B3213]TCZ90974.1 4-hydroxybenzoate octaprenyltransferase [Lysobacter sp. N42]